MLAIAFDPGLAKTGYCIAKDGEVVYFDTIYTKKGKPVTERLKEIIDHVAWLYWTMDKSFGRGYEHTLFDLCVIEEFQPFTQRPNMLVMMNVSKVAGMLFGFMWGYSKKRKFISKETITKEETRCLAIYRGVITKDAPKKVHDALDAYQLLVCAGVCK